MTMMRRIIAFMASGGVKSPLPQIDAAEHIINPNPDNATATISWNPDGTVSWNGSLSNFDDVWFEGTPDTTYYLKLVYAGNSVGLTSGTWYALSSIRNATLVQTVTGSKAAGGTYYISSSASDAGILGSAPFTVEVSVDI